MQLKYSPSNKVIGMHMLYKCHMNVFFLLNVHYSYAKYFKLFLATHRPQMLIKFIVDVVEIIISIYNQVNIDRTKFNIDITS